MPSPAPRPPPRRRPAPRLARKTSPPPPPSPSTLASLSYPPLCRSDRLSRLRHGSARYPPDSQELLDQVERQAHRQDPGSVALSSSLAPRDGRARSRRWWNGQQGGSARAGRRRAEESPAARACGRRSRCGRSRRGSPAQDGALGVSRKAQAGVHERAQAEVLPVRGGRERARDWADEAVLPPERAGAAELTLLCDPQAASSVTSRSRRRRRRPSAVTATSPSPVCVLSVPPPRRAPASRRCADSSPATGPGSPPARVRPDLEEAEDGPARVRWLALRDLRPRPHRPRVPGRGGQDRQARASQLSLSLSRASESTTVGS